VRDLLSRIPFDASMCSERFSEIPPKIHTFAELELVKDGSLTGGIEADHKNTHFLLAELFT
jgi:hypothetical protein